MLASGLGQGPHINNYCWVTLRVEMSTRSDRVLGVIHFITSCVLRSSTMEKYFSMMGLEHWGKVISVQLYKSSAFSAAESMTRIILPFGINSQKKKIKSVQNISQGGLFATCINPGHRFLA